VKITSSSVAYSLSQAKVPQLQEELGMCKGFGCNFQVSSGTFSFDVSSNLCFLLCQKTHVATTPNAVLNTGSSVGSSRKKAETPIAKKPKLNIESPSTATFMLVTSHYNCYDIKDGH
jgi:hypothetical protein